MFQQNTVQVAGPASRLPLQLQCTCKQCCWQHHLELRGWIHSASAPSYPAKALYRPRQDAGRCLFDLKETPAHASVMSNRTCTTSVDALDACRPGWCQQHCRANLLQATGKTLQAASCSAHHSDLATALHTMHLPCSMINAQTFSLIKYILANLACAWCANFDCDDMYR